MQWLGVAFVLAILLTSPGLAAADLGLALPSGDLAPLAIAAAAYFAVAALVGRWRVQRRIDRGIAVRVPRAIAVMRPRTQSQRRLAIAMSITAGIAEELMFRGLLIAAGVGILGLSVLWSAIIAAAFFAAAHLYQGPAALGAAALGLSFTGIYLFSGSLLPAVVAHIVIDIAALTVPGQTDVEPAPAPLPVPEPSEERKGTVFTLRAVEGALLNLSPRRVDHETRRKSA